VDPELHILFASDSWQICNYRCHCFSCERSKTEYNSRFSVSFINKGNFYYHTFREQLDSYTGSVLISKPDYEYHVTHPGGSPDECTLLLFSDQFFANLVQQYGKEIPFFSRRDSQSILLSIGPETEFTLDLLKQAVKKRAPSQLEADSLVMEILQQVLTRMRSPLPRQALPERLKRNHLQSMEKAKWFMRENYTRNISLEELASACHISVFHFSRIFRQFTGYSPYHYLQLIRLQQAAYLLKANIPIADVAFSSGFNSIDYFSAAFKKQFRLSPTAYRSRLQTQQDF
jgi:AraC-like DNA-binding protein